ncbi:hypothetical protein DVH24_011989 [Malus domestica]|uniref:Uncharacterized protein n=1 Tax=Malus domestica TaxID=3750 RepID=A0A498JDM6_MALDO|nr:hypothetical protein DVH24_011989 [Malus domestica]
MPTFISSNKSWTSHAIHNSTTCSDSSVLVQNTTIFNNLKAKTKLQSEERNVRLVVASSEIGSSIAVITYVILCVKEEVERERQKDCEKVRVAIEHKDGEGDDRQRSEEVERES